VKRHAVELESRGDICARSTCLCVQIFMPDDAETEFEMALMSALGAGDELVSDEESTEFRSGTVARA
jgi:hypothetical protein